jgi:negative regulator of sigma E activity
MKHQLLLSLLFLLSASSVLAAAGSGRLPTAEDIVAQMRIRDLQRQASMEGYVGMRRYILKNQRFHKRAEMLVRLRTDKNGTKHFDVISEDGWKGANTHVFRKMLESETETSLPGMRAHVQLTPQNYEFELIGTELVNGRKSYVLRVTPKRKEKYLFGGRIWVDSLDYALVRAEGNPAKKASFWITKTEFVQVNQKSGSTWFPVSTQSVTEALIFGTTDVSIEYFDYVPKSSQPSDNFAVSAKGVPQP